MRIRKVQAQSKYYRLRLPQKMAKKYIAQNGEYGYIHLHSPDTFCINCTRGIHIHILRVRELRGIIFNHFWQIMFPRTLSDKIQKGDKVHCSLRRNTLYLKFEHDID